MSGQAANLITAKGLFTFSSELTVPEGALVKADNINVDERGVITPRRGFTDYGAALSLSTDRFKQLMSYKNILFRHYNSTLEFDNGSGTFTAFSGTYTEIEEGFRIKYKEANSNFYFTTDSGIKKITARNASQITSTSITNAGGIKAYEIEGSPVISASGFMPTESKCAYRVVFGTRDNNNNVILGTPSSRVVVTNTSAVSNANATVTFGLTTGLTTSYFYQLYRTAPLQAVIPLTLNDIDPGDEMNLVIEAPITAANLSAGTITVSDVTPDSFRASGIFLYTNEITGEGILQSNDRPPLAKDIELFRNSMFYANTKTLHQLSLQFISVLNFTAGTTELYIGNSDGVRTYYAENVENVASQHFLLSASPSVAQAIDETARSLVKVINRDASSPVYAQYISGENDLPGLILLESRVMEDKPFFITTNDSAIANDISPVLVPIETLSTITFSSGSGSPAKITDAGHGLFTADKVFIKSPNTTPAIYGEYEITVLNANEFTIPVNITGQDLVGTNAFYFLTNQDVQSTNNESSNRVYFSKLNQPEAVPSVNYIDVGPRDQDIERIIALRDNLFVLKTDGVYVIDGVSAPNFSVRLLDNSANIIAPDTAVVLSNQIYALSSQGVVTITETGVGIISRPVENIFLEITEDDYNFRLPSFGVAYESDRSYIIWVPTRVDDTVATQAFRYNVFEQAWTRWTKPATCGLVLPRKDKLYIGQGDRNYMQEERKNRDRTDHSERNFNETISTNGIIENVIELPSVNVDTDTGDVAYQIQYLTLTEYNRLLRKLDIDAGLDDTDYESSLKMVAGDNITTKFQSLNDKLVIDDTSGIITAKVASTNWQTLQTQFNTLIDELNNASCDTLFKNYVYSEDTKPFEAIITDIDRIYNTITVNYPTNFIEGTLTIYKGFTCEIQWSPQYFGNPAILKQVREGTIIFDQNNFYNAVVSYSSDLSQGFVDIPFTSKGTGFWGSAEWGSQSPDFYWGGQGNDVPLRTIIPTQKQRCRYLNVKYTHFNSREYWRILGIGAVVRPLSTRAYR